MAGIQLGEAALNPGFPCCLCVFIYLLVQTIQKRARQRSSRLGWELQGFLEKFRRVVLHTVILPFQVAVFNQPKSSLPPSPSSGGCNAQDAAFRGREGGLRG